MCLNCHVVTVDIEFNSLPAIKAACERLGWEFREDQQTYKWVGTWVDDSTVPRHLFPTKEDYDCVVNMTRDQRRKYMPTILGKCDHAIGIPGAQGQIGLIQRGDKFIPIWDYYADGLYKLRAENGIAGFAQAYAIERAKIEAMTHGNFATEQQEQDGTIKLSITIPEY